MKRSKDFFAVLFKKIQKDDSLFLASGLAFNVLSCLLPILLSFIYLIGLLTQSANTIEVIDKVLTTAFPNQPHALAIRKVISTILTDIIANRKSLGILSMAVLVVISASLFASMRTVLHRVYEIQERRHFLMSYLIDMALVLGATTLLISTLFLRSIFHMLSQFIRSLPGFDFLDAYYFIDLFAPYASIPVVLITCFLLYSFVPVRRIPSRTAWISAVTTTLLWEFAGGLFAWYIKTFSAFSKTYGTYAFLIVLLLWVFYSCLVFVLGAQVGKILGKKATREQSSA